MKRFSILISFSICIVMLFSPANEEIRTLAMEVAPVDNQSADGLSPVNSSAVSEINQAPETPDDSGNTGPSNQAGTLLETNNHSAASENQRQLSSPKSKGPGLSPIIADADPTTKDIVLNSLPEVNTPKDPDTLGKIVIWWSANPLEMKFWYLFLALSIIVFLFGQTAFRKPLLFVNLVIFGFYLGNAVNPINSIFSLPIQTGVELIDSLILVVIPIVLSLFIGRFFCGWSCPIGAIQEFIHPENLKLRLPSLLDRTFSYFRFLLLVGGILLSWSAMFNVWNSYDPFQSLFTFKWSLTATSLLIIIMIGSILIERFFCRYLCPLGAVLAITSRFSLFKMRPEPDACIACGKCSQPGVCSMQMVSSLNPYTDIPTIESSECIICHRCANLCRYSAVKFSFFKKKKTKSQRSQSADANLST